MYPTAWLQNETKEGRLSHGGRKEGRRKRRDETRERRDDTYNKNWKKTHTNIPTRATLDLKEPKTKMKDRLRERRRSI